jgi:hypothetical protein
MIVAERNYARTAVGQADPVGDHDDTEGSGFLLIPMAMLS